MSSAPVTPSERRDAANARIAQLESDLAARQQRLERAQQASASAAFDPAAAQLLAGPSYSGGYVFPVGGGPGVVLASHTHHDYPAVDIAAPLGSPLYALADSVVLRSWDVPDPRCGIGFTVRRSTARSGPTAIWRFSTRPIVPGAILVRPVSR